MSPQYWVWDVTSSHELQPEQVHRIHAADADAAALFVANAQAMANPFRDWPRSYAVTRAHSVELPAVGTKAESLVHVEETEVCVG